MSDTAPAFVSPPESRCSIRDDRLRGEQASCCSRIAKRIGTLGLWAGGAIWLVVLVFYLWRPDGVATLRYIPVWAWLMPGVALGAVGCMATPRWRGAVLAMSWILAISILADESGGLLRACVSQPPEFATTAVNFDGATVRVVSLNTSVSTPDALHDALDLSPDVLLLQECNHPTLLQQIIQERWGDSFDAVWSRDASIVVRGKIRQRTEVAYREARRWVYATAELRGGVRLSIVSLRLQHVTVRYDLWSPACWRQHAQESRQRQEQLDSMLAFEPIVRGGLPLIVGGDFNALPHDSLFKRLEEQLVDVVEEVGTGWLNTYPADMPLARIDRVWVSEEFEPLSAGVQSTKYSDHKMVVTDLRLPENAAVVESSRE